MSDWETVTPQRRASDGWEAVGPAPKPEAAQSDPIQGAIDTGKTLLRGFKDYQLGGLKGAAEIGATLLSPIDRMMGKTDRRQQLAEFAKDTGSDTALGKTGELAMQIAGTAGVPGAIAKPVAGLAPKFAQAIQSGGFNLGGPAATTIGGKAADALTRVAGGAIAGGASAGLVNPESADTGAVIGAALPPAVKAAGVTGKALKSAGEHILGAVTGTGAESVRQAFKAGATGSTDFLKNMRGDVPFDDVVATAKQGLQTMRQERGNAYRSGMVDIKGDKTVLDMKPITDAVDNMTASSNFKGKVINEESAPILKRISDKVDDWAKSAPDEFHTPEGLDALKQAIGDIRDATQHGSNARRVADNVYNKIKDQIKAQAPAYEKVMRDYSEASKTLSEIEHTLSLGEKAKKDTAIRKLQSLMRNNAQTNYGNRLGLASKLEQQGGVELQPAIAGQSMNSWMPRGMVGSIEKAGAIPTAALAPWMLALAPFTSPRLMGEAAYGVGALSRGAANAMGSTPGGLLGGSGSGSALENPAIRNALIQLYAR